MGLQEVLVLCPNYAVTIIKKCFDPDVIFAKLFEKTIALYIDSAHDNLTLLKQKFSKIFHKNRK